jgi:hypothetical protein
MVRVVTRFVHALREVGIRVSPGESLDAVQALALGGVEGRDGVRSLLQMTLVKNSNDIPVFDDVFDWFFSRDQVNPLGIDTEDFLNALVHIVEGEEFTAAMKEKQEEDGPTLVANQELTPEDLKELESLKESDDDSDGADIMVQMKGYRGKMHAPKPSEYNMQNLPTVAFNQNWSNERIAAFTPVELVDMQEVVARMLIRIRKDIRKMKEEESRGKLHVMRTLQKNYKNGMVPFHLSLRRKRKVNPRLVVLCDVSFSVSHASRFMLLLLHTLHNRVMDVRSFIFNRELAEITDLLTNLPVNSLLEVIDRGMIVNPDDNSDYGHVFVTFKKRHLENMRGKPSVIILGDARNNYNEANDWALDEIRERAGYLLWLTPEERSTWKRGDCLIDLYGSYCDKVEVVQNVDELSLVVEDLFSSIYLDRAPRNKDRTPKDQDEEPVDYRNYYGQAEAAKGHTYWMQNSPCSPAWRERFGIKYGKKK